MDMSSEYILMSKKAREDLKPIFQSFSSERKLGSILCFRSFIGMIIWTKGKKERNVTGLISVIPETLAVRTWCELDQDLTIIENTYILKKDGLEVFDNEEFILFRQDQLQSMIEIYRWGLTKDGKKWLTWKIGEMDFLEDDSPEKALLKRVMKEKYNKTWNGE